MRTGRGVQTALVGLALCLAGGEATGQPASLPDEPAPEYPQDDPAREGSQEAALQEAALQEEGVEPEFAPFDETLPDTLPGLEGEAIPFEALRTIVIDPGHGGTDGGCVGAARVPEKLLTLKVSRLLERALLGRVERVVMTRTDDSYPTLEERTHLANMERADAFLSLHFNCALNVEAQGIETFYLHPEGTVPGDVVPGMEELGASQLWLDMGAAGELPALIAVDLARTGATWVSSVLAHRIQAGLIAETGMADRGVRQAQFRVLRGALAPAVVLELGFLTHAREGEEVLEDERLVALVRGVVAGLYEFDRWMVESR